MLYNKRNKQKNLLNDRKIGEMKNKTVNLFG